MTFNVCYSGCVANSVSYVVLHRAHQQSLHLLENFRRLRTRDGIYNKTGKRCANSGLYKVLWGIQNTFTGWLSIVFNGAFFCFAGNVHSTHKYVITLNLEFIFQSWQRSEGLTILYQCSDLNEVV